MARITIGRTRMCAEYQSAQMKTIKYFQEEERQPFVVHLPKTKFVPSLANPAVFEHFEKPLRSKPHVGVQEEPREQNFNNEEAEQQSECIFLRSYDQQRKRSNDNECRDKGEDTVHICPNMRQV